MKQAFIDEMNTRLEWVYTNDQVKPVFAPFETLGKEMVDRLATTQGSILVLSDCGLLIALLLNNRKADITFVAHTERQAEFARQVSVTKIIQIGYNDPIKELEKQIMGLKFDIVVGNPPYDSAGAKNIKLWRKFSELCLTFYPEYLGFVTPNNVISDKGKNGSALRSRIKDEGYGFICAVNHHEKRFAAGVETCHWIIAKNHSNSVDPIQIKTHQGEHAGQSILDKIDGSTDERLQLVMNNGWIKKEHILEVPGKNAIYFSGQKRRFTNEQIENQGTLKLVFPFSSSYHKQFITEDALGMLNLFHPISSKKQGERIMSYSLSKAMIYFAKHFKKTSGFCPAVKNNRIPKLDDSRVWTDQDIYDHFGLSANEIALIEAEIK